MRVCKTQGSTATGCDTSFAVEVGYIVIDASQNANFSGIEAGTFSQSGQVDSSTTSPTYAETFATTPLVFAAVQTVNGDDPIEVRLTSTSTTGFTAGICQQNSLDACDGSHPSETVGWVAIELGNTPFNELNEGGSVSISNSAWTTQAFSNSYSEAPVAIVETQTNNGGQEVEIDEARNISTSGMDVRYCEMETVDVCDTHTGENVGWFVIESGTFDQDVSLDLDTFRLYENVDAIQPTTALAAENTGLSNLADGEIIRLRAGIQAGLSDLPASSIALKLQYTQATTCSSAGGWQDVGAAGSDEIWRGFDNSTPSDGANVTSNLLTTSDDTQSYVEENNAPSNPNGISDGDNGEWDFVIESNGANEGTDYCFRVVLSDDSIISYTNYPTVSTLALPTEMYIERDTGFTATTGTAWTNIDLSASPHFVPKNRVVEIAIGNNDVNSGITAGVRSTSSTSINRFLELREGEAGGNSFLILHTQTDNNGEIQYYTNNTPEYRILCLGLLGKWYLGRCLG